MKKIVIILMMILLCGCDNLDAEQNDNDKIIEVTKEELLEKEMKEFYSREENLLKEENVGKSYFTPLRATNTYIENKEKFENCNKTTSGYSIYIYNKNSEIYANYKIYLVCNGVTTTYNYNDLSEKSEPTSVIERNS